MPYWVNCELLSRLLKHRLMQLAGCQCQAPEAREVGKQDSQGPWYGPVVASKPSSAAEWIAAVDWYQSGSADIATGLQQCGLLSILFELCCKGLHNLNAHGSCGGCMPIQPAVSQHR